MEQTIRIACAGHVTLGLDELVELQGNLKDLTEENYVKLRNSITEYGFSFPLFYWESEGVKYIIDAHQRLRTLRKMRDEGWTIPPLPADPIEAKDRVEAKKKLLILQSRYGKITETGLADFVNEEGYQVNIDDISDILTFPEFSFDDEIVKVNEQEENQEPKSITCPACQRVFTP